MSIEFDDIAVGKRFFVGDGNPEIFGRGPTEVRGSAYVEGPEIVGDPGSFTAPSPTELGTVMAGPTTNTDMKPIPFYQLLVKTFARVAGYLKVDILLSAKLVKAKVVYCEVLMAKVKNFVIPHPTKPNKKLYHSCLEGPENGVYFRGRLTGTNVIYLPEYWTGLVEELSITVSLTAIGAHQDIIIKRIGDNKVYLQAKGGMPIDCYYHIFAERKDIERLKLEG